MKFMKRFRFKASAETQPPGSPRTSLRLYRATGLGIFLLGLLAGVYLGFPDEVLRQRLSQELETRFPIRVDLAEVGLRPLLTLTGEKGVIRYPDGAETIASIERFSFSPLWTSLFTGDPGVKGNFSTGGGELAFRWQRSGSLAMHATNLPVNFPLPGSPAMRIAGVIATGQMTSAAAPKKVPRSLVDITIEKAVLQGLGAMSGDAAGLRLGKVSLRMSGQGTELAIERLDASGGDLVVSGKGTLLLSPANPLNSRINFSLSLRPGKQEDQTMANFLALVGPPLPDGSRMLLLTGTLANPVIR
ncbi:MAG: type II secretion system protein GspN [Desulfurivibrionaceae bacterium]